MSEDQEDVFVISCVLRNHGDACLLETGDDLVFVEENEPNMHDLNSLVDCGCACLSDEIGDGTAELTSSVEKQCLHDLRGECGGSLPFGELFGRWEAGA